ncbi:MAG: M23 family metallopeptidase [Solirubrobacteraceae bacterium]|nr:M23 family metallopeptidase [Solirubrobacteraceae bacterium]
MPPRRVAIAAAAALTGLVTPTASTASAPSGGGIAIAPSAEAQAKSMVVRKISCVRGCRSIDSVKAGAVLRFQGPLLTKGRRVVYLGGAGDQDDVLAKLRVQKVGRDKVAVAALPKRAHSGPVAIEITDGVRSPASTAAITVPGQAIRIADVAPLTGPGPFFPIRGVFKFGTGTAAFGGGRHHEGQDVFAKCGTPLVAAEAGVVTTNKFHARAGNYLVVDVDGGAHDEMYAHLKAPALPPLGTRVEAGTPIGEVGDTGRADGCHLHFELWEGNWQGVGGAGKPVDPLATLKAWAAAPNGPAAPPAALASR